MLEKAMKAPVKTEHPSPNPIPPTAPPQALFSAWGFPDRGRTHTPANHLRGNTTQDRPTSAYAKSGADLGRLVPPTAPGYAWRAPCFWKTAERTAKASSTLVKRHLHTRQRQEFPRVHMHVQLAARWQVAWAEGFARLKCTHLQNGLH